MTGIGPVGVRCPRVRDRVGEGSQRNSLFLGDSAALRAPSAGRPADSYSAALRTSAPWSRAEARGKRPAAGCALARDKSPTGAANLLVCPRVRGFADFYQRFSGETPSQKTPDIGLTSIRVPPTRKTALVKALAACKSEKPSSSLPSSTEAVAARGQARRLPRHRSENRQSLPNRPRLS